MEQSMRRFMKVGIILYVSYPQLEEGGGPIPECLERICKDGHFEVVEVAKMKDLQIRKQVTEMIRMAHMVSACDGQPRTLLAGLSINDPDEAGRAMVMDTLKEGINGAYEMGYVDFSSLFGRYGEERKEQALEQLLKSTRRLYGHAEEKGQMPVYCEVPDYDTDKRALIGPVVLTARYIGRIRKEHGNFGLLVDLGHIPMTHETIEENVFPTKDYIIHAHMGSTIIKSPDCGAYGGNHPRLGFPSSENDVGELAHYLGTLKEIGFPGEKGRPVVGLEVKPWKDESPEVVIANAKRILNLT